MSNPDFGHDHNKRDAWKKMSEWSHSLSDEDLNELFPHIYGPLNLDSVVEVIPI